MFCLFNNQERLIRKFIFKLNINHISLKMVVKKKKKKKNET